MKKKQQNMLSAMSYPALKGYVWTVEDAFIKKKDDRELKDYVMKNRKVWKDESKDFFLRSLAKARYAIGLKYLDKRNINRDFDEIPTEGEETSSGKFKDRISDVYDVDYEILDIKSEDGTRIFKVKVGDRVEKLWFTDEGGLLDRVKVEDNEDD